MREDAFYQDSLEFLAQSTEYAVPLIFITKSDYMSSCADLLSTYVRAVFSAQKFTGAPGELAWFYNSEGGLASVYVGAGLAVDAHAVSMAAVRIPPGVYSIAHTLNIHALLGWSLAQYKFDLYKPSQSKERRLLVDPKILPELLIQAHAIFLVRDLINTPASDMNPEHLGLALSSLALQHGAEYQDVVGTKLLEDGFSAIHAVGRASDCDPRLLSLTFGEPHHPRVTLVGKGVCFDSGGLDIKPSAGMRLMKKDMGGAAQVFGLSYAIMALQLPIRLHVLIPAVENAIGSRSYRPGDVLKMRNGLTVEIDNTDAEGRLILADALVKACEEEPEIVIDFATLTGAARVAVGTEIAAMFTPDPAIAAAMLAASDAVHDPVWHMPLYSGYASLLDSSIADMTNSTASAYAGAITAALFLQRFVSKSTDWVHFDVMAWNVSNKPGRPEGGEAMGMLTVLEYLRNRYPKLPG